MKREQAMELAKRIEGQHGLANREDQRFFFDGMIYYYTMRNQGDYFDAWVKDSKGNVWRFTYTDNDIAVEVVDVENDLRKPVKRSF